VHFTLRFAEKDLQPPVSGMAVLRNCGRIERITVPIEIGEHGVAQFTAAAGCLAMVLELEPFESVVADRVLSPGEQSLGEFVLLGAGAADVRVVRDPNGAFVQGATVRAMSDESKDGRSIVVAEAVTGDGGWAHLTGLPTYWSMFVDATAREGDKSDSAVLRVEPRQRAVVDPLVIPKPGSLVIDAKIDEAFLVRFPAARVVTLVVRPADPARASEKRQANTLKTESPTRFDGLHPGRWLLGAVVSVAGTYAPLELEEVELKAGDEQHVDVTLAPNVFEGVVTSAGKGIAAKVIIEEGGRTLYFSSDADGTFRVTLQERGVYRIAVSRLSAQGNIIPLGEVAFTDPARRIEIAIPAGGSVTTRVRSGDQAVPATSVWLARRDSGGMTETLTNRAQTTDGGGETTFDDLTPGMWTFSVRANEGRRGAEKTIKIQGGKTVTLDLNLADSASIEGTIRALGGSPLPRAHVDCLYVGPSGNPDRASVDADAEGSFAVELLAPSPPFALCSVVGPMGTAEAFKAIPGRRVDLTVTGATATLQIPDWAEERHPAEMWLVAHDGNAISLHAVAMEMGRFGTPLRIPALAARSWKLVRAASLQERIALSTGMGASLPALSEVTLRAGTVETIRLNDTTSPADGRPASGTKPH
jgi:hypothetical protein